MQDFLKVVVVVLLIAFIVPSMLGMTPLPLDVKLQRIHEVWSTYVPPQEVVTSAPSFTEYVVDNDNFFDGVLGFFEFLVASISFGFAFLDSLITPFGLLFHSFAVLAFNATAF